MSDVVIQIPGLQGPPGINFRNAWLSGASYLARDAVYIDGSSYRCTVGHVASAVTMPGVGPLWSTVWTPMALRGDDASLAPRIEVTADYVVTGSQSRAQICGRTEVYTTVTFGTPANYSDVHWNVVRNERATRGLRIEVGDGRFHLLYPGQQATVYRAGAAWIVVDPGLWYPTATVNLYAALLGTDAYNDGLSSGSPLSIEDAKLRALRDIFTAGNVNINIADGSYAYTANTVTSGVRGGGLLIFVANATPESVVINAVDDCFAALGGKFSVTGGFLLNGATFGFRSRDYGAITYEGVRFGTLGTGSWATQWGKINAGNCSVVAGASMKVFDDSTHHGNIRRSTSTIDLLGNLELYSVSPGDGLGMWARTLGPSEIVYTGTVTINQAGVTNGYKAITDGEGFIQWAGSTLDAMPGNKMVQERQGGVYSIGGGTQRRVSNFVDIDLANTADGATVTFSTTPIGGLTRFIPGRLDILGVYGTIVEGHVVGTILTEGSTLTLHTATGGTGGQVVESVGTDIGTGARHPRVGAYVLELRNGTDFFRLINPSIAMDGSGITCTVQKQGTWSGWLRANYKVAART